MRMTPLDVQSHRFGRRLSGYDTGEVDAFLRMIADDYESLLRENESLRDQARRLETRVEELVANERLLQETLTSARAMSDELRKAAAKESEVLLREAEVKAEKILDAAHRRAGRLAEDIREMRGLRTRLGAALRAAVETHVGLIDSLEQDPDEDPLLDGKITYLPRPPKASSGSSGPAQAPAKGPQAEPGGG